MVASECPFVAAAGDVGVAVAFANTRDSARNDVREKSSPDAAIPVLPASGHSPMVFVDWSPQHHIHLLPCHH